MTDNNAGMVQVTVPADRVEAVRWLLEAPHLVMVAYCAPVFTWEDAWADPETAAWMKLHLRDWLRRCPDRK